MTTLYLVLGFYALYVIGKGALIYWADKKLREREEVEKRKTRRYKVRVREYRSDDSDFPF